jgi:putative DNA methylase
MNTRAQVELRTGEDQRDAARRAYVEGMAEAFSAMGHSVLPHGIAGVVFAHTDPDAWATLIEGLLDARLIPDASWPIDTELENKVARLGQARLSTSVWMACTPRARDAGNAFLGDVMMEMRPVIRERLIYFWSKGIRGADFFISAIGPALSVFGRHSKVMRPDGSEVTVQDFLDLVRRESTQVALEQVLQGADLGMVDATTQQFVTWVWSASRAPLDAGEAIALCLATGADYGEVVRTDSIAAEVKDKNKKTVRLRTIKERGERDEHLGLNQPARPAPLIDQLQRSAWLWSVNRTDELTSFRSALGETRWQALRTLGQAVAECLPDADDDRRLINGLLSSSVMATAPPKAPPGSLDAASVASRRVPAARAGAALPGFEAEDSDGS